MSESPLAHFAATAGGLDHAPTSSKDLFNRDGLGLPQNEESVTVCPSNPNIVVGGTNDFRGLLDPEVNFTGWHLSTDGGLSLLNEGLLPHKR